MSIKLGHTGFILYHHSTHIMVHAWLFSRFFLLVFITLTLPSPCEAEPWQCRELQPIVEPCRCEGKIGDETLVVIVCNNLQLEEVPNFPQRGSSNNTVYEMTLAQNKIQTIPAERFIGLKIQRLDLTENRLTNISINAFRGLENDLLELKVGAEIGTPTPIPRASLTNLTALHTLHLEYFKFPNNELQMNSGLHELTNLKTLTLAYNNLSFMASTSLPIKLTTLTLDHQGLTSIPVDLLRSLEQLQSLTITNTAISTLGRLTFEKNERLNSLDIGYNRINNLKERCFDGITTSLQSLIMRNNPINRVDVISPLKHLNALTYLQLSNIGLTSMPPDPEFLNNKTSLVRLHLDDNALTVLVPDVFKGVKNLQELSLSNNQLNSIANESVSGFSSLTSLDLSHQTIPSSQTLVLPASLGTIKSLQTLRLSGTPLDHGALWRAVSSLSALKTLHVDSTKLMSIEDYTLMNLKQLTEINLDNNKLSALTQAMLAGPRTLSKLWVNNNNITTVSRCVLYNFTLSPALDLQLSGNPMHCDCQLDWLLTEIAQKRIKVLGSCATPLNLKDKSIDQSKPGDFTCVPGQPDPPPCSELYTTMAPPTTTPHPLVVLEVTGITKTSVNLDWTIAYISGLSYFKVSHLEVEQGNVLILSDSIDKEKRSWEISGLKEGTSYSFCLKVHRSAAVTITECVQNTTLGGTQDPDKQNQSSGNDSETGIIIGVVIGVLVFLVILGVILYIVLLRKRSTKKDLPVQPHTFSASELPGMGPETRHFTRPREEDPKKKPPPRVGRALDGDIKITVISDGRTGPTSPKDRQSVGSYQFLDEKHPNPNPEMEQPDSGYKDMSRSLPSAPADSMESYYNHGFNRDSNSHHVYNQIDL